MHRGHIQKDIHTNIHPPWQIRSSLPHTIHLCPAVPTTTPIPLGKCVHIRDCKYVCVGVCALLPTSTIHKFTPPQLLHPSLHPLTLHHYRPAVTTHKMQIESIFFLNSWWIKKNLQIITILFFFKRSRPPIHVWLMKCRSFGAKRLFTALQSLTEQRLLQSSFWCHIIWDREQIT